MKSPSRSPLWPWPSRLPRLPRLIPSRRSPFSWLLILLLLLLLIEPTLRLRRFVVPPPAAELDAPFRTACQEPDTAAPRERAALVMLARNEDLAAAARSIDLVERRFNRWFHYPVVFLNDAPWDDRFVSTLSARVSGGARFEVLPNTSWGFPDGVDFDVAAARASFTRQERTGVRYGGSESYHHMCRFFSGEFFTLPALAEFRYYWRIEPDVKFFCDLTYDPFVEMRRHDKVYGWTMALWEMPDTVPSLFRATADYRRAEGIPESPLWTAMLQPGWTPWSLRWWRAARGAGMFDHNGDRWSLCHFWSNFEIADMDWFRAEDYQKYYRHLLAQGGFYHERVSNPLLLFHDEISPTALLTLSLSLSLPLPVGRCRRPLARPGHAARPCAYPPLFRHWLPARQPLCLSGQCARRPVARLDRTRL